MCIAHLIKIQNLVLYSFSYFIRSFRIFLFFSYVSLLISNLTFKLNFCLYSFVFQLDYYSYLWMKIITVLYKIKPNTTQHVIYRSCYRKNQIRFLLAPLWGRDFYFRFFFKAYCFQERLLRPRKQNFLWGQKVWRELKELLLLSHKTTSQSPWPKIENYLDEINHVKFHLLIFFLLRCILMA